MKRIKLISTLVTILATSCSPAYSSGQYGEILGGSCKISDSTTTTQKDESIDLKIFTLTDGYQLQISDINYINKLFSGWHTERDEISKFTFTDYNDLRGDVLITVMYNSETPFSRIRSFGMSLTDFNLKSRKFFICKKD